MTDDEKAQAIERDRRKREDELLLLLLLLSDDLRREIRNDFRDGFDTQYIDTHLTRFTVRASREIARSMAQAHATAFMRLGRITGQDISRADAPPDLAEQYKPMADEAARAMATTIRQSVFKKLAERSFMQSRVNAGVATDDEAAVAKMSDRATVKDAFDSAGYTAAHPKALDVGVERQIVLASNSGMLNAINTLPIALGIRHVSVIDSGTTPICRARDGYTLPADDPYWLTNCPSLHWGCRSVLIAVPPGFEQSERRILPPPDPGFGQGFLPAFAAGTGARTW